MPMTDTVRAVLAAAAEQPAYLVVLPNRLPAAARQAVARSMLRAGLLEEMPAADEWPVWRTGEDGQRQNLRATQAGLGAVGTPATSVVIIQPSSRASARLSLRSAAQAVLQAWDDPDPHRPALPGFIDALGSVLALSKRSSPDGPRQPRPDTKRAAVLAMLRRQEGATVTQVIEATGWARHTVHGFLAGLKKAATPVTVLGRVKQVGAGQGSKGSYTVYGIKEAS